MSCLGKIAFGLAGGLMLNAALRAQELSSTNNPLPNNPYAEIVVRNVFDLKPPIDPKAEEDAQKAKDLPKIDATGIQSFPGMPPQVLFKTSGGGMPGKPAKDKYYCLAEGQMEDEIEVTKIDSENAIVSFNNHGTEQDIPLVPPGSSESGGPSGGGPDGGTNPGNPFGRGLNGAGTTDAGGIIHFAGRGPKRPQGMANNANYNAGGPTGPNVGLNFGGIQGQNRIYQPQATGMTPEESALMMALQKQQAIDSGSPEAKLFPPGPLDKDMESGK